MMLGSLTHCYERGITVKILLVQHCVAISAIVELLAWNASIYTTGMVYNFGCVCMHACMYVFQKP